MIKKMLPAPKDFGITAAILLAVTGIGFLFEKFGFTDANIVTVYILGVLLVSWLTQGYVCGALASILSVSLFNFFYTEPRWTLRAYDSDYWITFTVMLLSSVITATLASKLKDQAILSEQAAFRTKTLLETNQLLQKAKDEEEMFQITVDQLSKLLRCEAILYPQVNGALDETRVTSASTVSDLTLFLKPAEKDAARRTFDCRNGSFDHMPSSQAMCIYYPMHIGDTVYGVVGVRTAEKALAESESAVVQSILAECALAIENDRNAKGKQQASLLAENERLRANLMRMISHDLRTPLTAIYGNASNLLSNYDVLTPEECRQIFGDIAQDAQWLTDLVENLLSITRISEGKMQLKLSLHLMDEVIEEAVRQAERRTNDHPISTAYSDELLLVRIDARLMVQVILNLVDNAVKYTPPGTPIAVTARKNGDRVVVTVADSGDGISDAAKPHVFEMFFSGENSVADGRRSLGLGLALCRSVLHAHDGEITLTDNVPHGCVFTFSIPVGEADIHA